MFRSTPFLKVTVRLYCPSLVLCENMYSMSSTPLTCCSMGAAPVEATTSASAPGYWQLTWTVGGVICGYCASGKEKRATPPASVITIDSTDAKIGRSMKKRENMYVPVLATGEPSPVRGRVTRKCPLLGPLRASARQLPNHFVAAKLTFGPSFRSLESACPFPRASQ